MSQPTNEAGSKKQFWDEQNQKFVFDEISYGLTEGLDAESLDSESDVLDIKKNSKVMFQIVHESGDPEAIGDLSTELYTSINGTDFVSTGTAVNGAGMTTNPVDCGRYAKVKVNNAIAVPGTFKVIISAI